MPSDDAGAAVRASWLISSIGGMESVKRLRPRRRGSCPHHAPRPHPFPPVHRQPRTSPASPPAARAGAGPGQRPGPLVDRRAGPVPPERRPLLAHRHRAGGQRPAVLSRRGGRAAQLHPVPARAQRAAAHLGGRPARQGAGAGDLRHQRHPLAGRPAGAAAHRHVRGGRGLPAHQRAPARGPPRPVAGRALHPPAAGAVPAPPLPPPGPAHAGAAPGEVHRRTGASRPRLRHHPRRLPPRAGTRPPGRERGGGGGRVRPRVHPPGREVRLQPHHRRGGQLLRAALRAQRPALGQYTQHLAPAGKTLFNVPLSEAATATAVADRIDAEYAKGVPGISLAIEDGNYVSDSPRDPQLQAGIHDKYALQPSNTDAMMALYNQVGRILRERHPTSPTRIGGMAYANVTIPPQQLTSIEPNVVMWLAPIDIDPNHGMDAPDSPPEQEYRAMMERWAALMQGRLAIYDYDQGQLVWRDLPNR